MNKKHLITTTVGLVAVGFMAWLCFKTKKDIEEMLSWNGNYDSISFEENEDNS